MNIMKFSSKSIYSSVFSATLAVILLPSPATAQDEPSNKKLDNNKTQQSMDYKYETDKVKWRSVNDSVMGGRSEGNFYFSESDHLMFKGDISLKNNGGFASIRNSGSQYDLSDKKGLAVTVRGDGRTYYFTARTDGRNRLAFWSPIETKAGEWITVEVPFDSFYATSFGQKIPKLKLNTSKISSLGFMLYDKKDGDFSLEIKSIKTY